VTDTKIYLAGSRAVSARDCGCCQDQPPPKNEVEHMLKLGLEPPGGKGATAVNLGLPSQQGFLLAAAIPPNQNIEVIASEHCSRAFSKFPLVPTNSAKT
jgi:hypothetical protein